MNIGELFIKLGIKTEGLAQISVVKEKVTKSITQAGVAVSRFKTAFEKLKDTYTKVSDKVKGFSQKLQDSKGTLGDWVSNIKVAQVQLVAFGASIVAVTKKASDYAAQLVRFNSVTGMSSQYLQSLSQDAAASGIEFGEVEESLKGLQSRMLDVQMGQGDISPFARLGIDPRSDPSAVIEQLKTKLNTMGPQMGSKFARDLGLSDSFIAFLKEAKSLPPADKSLLLSDKEIQNLKEFNIYFNRIFDNVKRILQRFGAQMMPLAKAIVFAVERIGLVIKDVGTAFDWIANRVQGFQGILTTVVVALAALFAPLTFGIAGVVLVLDDFFAFMRGDKSVIGGYVELFKNWDLVLKGLIITVKELWDSFNVKDAVKATIDTVKSMISSVGSAFGLGDTEVGQSAKTKAAAAGATNNASTQNNNVEINVNGAGKPESVATEVAKKLKGTMSNTMFQQPVGGI